MPVPSSTGDLCRAAVSQLHLTFLSACGRWLQRCLHHPLLVIGHHKRAANANPIAAAMEEDEMVPSPSYRGRGADVK